MPRFFVPSVNFEGKQVKITGSDAWHIARALRMAVGESVSVCDMHGGVHTCILRRISDTEVLAEITESVAAAGDPPVRIVLYQALPKGDKMDLIVQKAVEFGAYAVVPFVSERCISRPADDALEKKRVRWQRIALEAAKQCGRGIVPEVRNALSFCGMLERAATAPLVLFCYEGDGTRTLRGVLKEARPARFMQDEPPLISLVIGCEGGFSAAEAAAARAGGFHMCGLGRRILRCESASAFALACMSYEYELQE